MTAAVAMEVSRSSVVNLEAEQALLGALLANNETLAFLQVHLEPRHFSEPVHARIFEAAASLIREGRQATPITLKSYFEDDATLKEIGGVTYLARLAGAATTILSAPHYAALVVDLAMRREGIDRAIEAVSDLQTLPVDQTGEQYIAEMASDLAAIATGADMRRSSFGAESVMAMAIDETAAAYQHDGMRPDAIKTGISALDGKLGGFIRGDFIVIGARPSMGKSALAVAILRNAAAAGISGLMISLEMKATKLGHRLQAIESGIPFSRIQWGKISEREFSILVEASRQIATLPFTIEDRHGLSVAQLDAAVAREKIRHPDLGLVIVDYLGLVEPSERYRGRKVDELGEISTHHKRIGKRHNVAMVALHQLSRGVEGRENKRPQLSDLRESGNIEQDADIVMLIYREEYYLIREEPKPASPQHNEWEVKLEACRGTAELIIGKNRQGPTGIVKVGCDLTLNRFFDLEKPIEAPQEAFSYG